MAIDFGDIEKVKELLQQAQDNDKDNRERARESLQFLNKRDGQWEPGIINQMSGRPRYTFDKCNPIVNDIAGDIKKTSFGIRVQPAGGDATLDLAKSINGIIRNIQNVSNAKHIYHSAAKKSIKCGLSGWEVDNDYIDGDSFDQDLLVRPIHDYINTVWFVEGGTTQTQEDAPGVFKASNMTPDQYDEKFPEGSKQGIGEDKCYTAYPQKPAFIKVAKIIYKKEVTQVLALLSDNSVRIMDDEFEKIVDELAEQGITVIDTRTRETVEIWSRMFDGGGWLTDAEETVFKHLPIIPNYSNFDIDDDGKIIWMGAIDKLIDAQRCYNYARSREIEEGALAPRAKYWATRKQFENADDQAKVQTLNTNADPVQLYTHDPQQPLAPQQQGGAVVNPGLQGVIQNSLSDIQTSSSTFNQEANVQGKLSQVAIETLENRATDGSVDYIESQELAICHTGKVIMGALSRVYDSRRMVRVLGEDDKSEMITLNDVVLDQDTKQLIESNDLSKGTYDVTCDVGPLFKSRQQQTVTALQELSAIVPGLAEMTADIQLGSIDGGELAAERFRRVLFEAGRIPDSQLTDDEQEEMRQIREAQAQNPPEKSAEDKFADAETGRVLAETADVQNRGLLKQEELRIKEQQTLLTAQMAAEKLQLEEIKVMMEKRDGERDDQLAMNKAFMDGQALQMDMLKTQAETLKIIREAMGVDTIVGPHAQQAFIEQATIITEQQDSIEATLDNT